MTRSKKRRFPTWRQWRQFFSTLTLKEKRIFTIASLCVFTGFFIAGWQYVVTHQVEIPTIGGEYTEGLIGEPQFINPLYASASDADSDIASLIYSGLVRWDEEEGIVNDLASNITKSEDGKTYTVTIRDGAMFHNGDNVLASDVVYTFNAIQNTAYHSPLAVSFSGVTVNQIDEKTISFELEEPFAPFLSTLTVGILPANIWGMISPRNAQTASYNLEPIGSGPYRFAEFSKDKSGTIHSYTLERFDDYYGDKVLIERITFKFYMDAASAVLALENKHVEGVSYVSFDQKKEVEENKSIALHHPTIPREIVLFFNEETQPALKSLKLRQAISAAIDKNRILEEVTDNNGIVINSPILPGMLGYLSDTPEQIQDIILANELLDDEGFEWSEEGSYRIDPNNEEEEEIEVETEENEEEEETEEGEPTEEPETEEETTETEDETLATETNTATEESVASNTLRFTLTTVDSPEFIKVAELITEMCAEIGMIIEIDAYPAETLYSLVIDPRNYELLLTGVLLGIDSDPYAFWHSSQTKNGLNLAGYNNEDVDTLLEEARAATDESVRIEKYQEFQEILLEDYPAVFLYQSTYTYALSSKIQGADIQKIMSPSDRFKTISDWYIKTKKALR